MKSVIFNLLIALFLTVLFFSGCSNEKEVLTPTLSTSGISQITHNSAFGGGNIIDDGGAPITSRGLIWGKLQNPTLEMNDGFTSNGTGTGIFTCQISNLVPKNNYYLKAYATNIAGTSYGDEKSFRTTDQPNNPPNKPLNIAPIDRSSGISTSTTLNWNCSDKDGDALTYNLYFGASNILNTIISINQSGTSFLKDRLSNGITYFWKVVAKDIHGDSTIGDISTFTTTGQLGILTDIDGYLYSTVTIGTQTWMKSNLRTTKLNDGSPIFGIQTADQWKTFTNPAYCFYDNNYNKNNIYGALYNYYTVETGKVCPTGWHVPSREEFNTLISFLGGSNVAGGKLKESGYDHWKSPNTGANDESGFTMLPAGNRSAIGDNPLLFWDLGSYAVFWTGTVSNNHALCVSFSYNYASTGSWAYLPYNFGISIRCIKDQ